MVSASFYRAIVSSEIIQQIIYFCRLGLTQACVLMFYRHTAIVVHGKEYYFVAEGINSCLPVRITSVFFFFATFYTQCIIHL